MKKYFVFNYDGICYVGNSKTDSDLLSMACYFSDCYEEWIASLRKIFTSLNTERYERETNLPL